MYHGAASDNFQQLFQHGLDPRYADSNAGRMNGLGIDLSSVASKSDIYTRPNSEGERCVFVMRTMLGEPHFEKLDTPGRRAETKSWCLTGIFGMFKVDTVFTDIIRIELSFGCLP